MHEPQETKRLDMIAGANTEGFLLATQGIMDKGTIEQIKLDPELTQAFESGFQKGQLSLVESGKDILPSKASN